MTEEQSLREQRIDAEIAAYNSGPWAGHGSYARRPVLATDCDYEIVDFSGVMGRRLPAEDA